MTDKGTNGPSIAYTHRVLNSTWAYEKRRAKRTVVIALIAGVCGAVFGRFGSDETPLLMVVAAVMVGLFIWLRVLATPPSRRKPL